MVDRDRRQHFHYRAGRLGFLGSGHSLAAFLSAVDVHCDNCLEFAWQPMGIFHWNFRGRILGLRRHFYDQLLLEWLQQLSQWIHTGRLARPDLLIAVPAWFSNLLVVIGCLWAYSKLEGRRVRDALEFLACFVLATGFFAADMAIFQPRYLGLFPELLHPHLPW